MQNPNWEAVRKFVNKCIIKAKKLDLLYNTLKSCYHEFERTSHCSTGIFFSFLHIFTICNKIFSFHSFGTRIIIRDLWLG